MLLRIREGVGRWIVVLILGLIAVSFVFWGVDFNLTGPSYAASVNGDEIPLDEFERELQAEQSRFLELYRVELDEQIRSQLRRSVLDRLVRREALSQRVDELGYRVSDARLTEQIRSIEQFRVDGEFSLDAYRGQLAVQGISPTSFEALQREQLELLDLQTGIVNSAFVTPAEYERFVALTNQRRELAYALFEVDSFVEGIEIASEEIAKHYAEHGDRYMSEEAAAIEYVEIRREDIAADIEVSEEALREAYESQRDRYVTEEERRASHILITPGPDETDEAARARAEALVERIDAGEDFEALAAEHSDDPGTAESGGDLGWIGRGMLGDAFEEALYSLEVGEVAGPVRTDFGYHIIRLDELRAGDERSFEEVRDELADQLRNELADDRFFSRANELADVAFDEYDSLERVAMQLDLPLKRIERYPRSGDPEAFPNNGPVVEAVFGGDAVETGVNSDLLELSDDHVAVVRVTERYAPEQQPLEEVEDEIRRTLTRERARTLAAEAADAFAAALPETLSEAFLGGGDAGPESAAEPAAEGEAGGDAESAQPEGDAGGADGDGADAPSSPAAELAAEHGGTWIAPTWVRRDDASLPTEIVGTAFDMPEPDEGEHLRREIMLSGGDQALLVLSEVEPGDPSEVGIDERLALQQQMLDRLGNAELGGYAEAVRRQADVTIPPEVMDPQF